MSSYFVNSTFPVTLPGSGQASAESFLGQIPLYSSAYTTDSLRHYPGAAAVTAAAVAYGASGVHQEKQYSASNYYQQAASGAYTVHRAPGLGVSNGVGACDYTAAAASFYREKDPTACSLEEHSLSLSQDIVNRKTECPGLSGKGLFGEMVDDKQSTTPVYPWMQRMNACNGKSRSVPLSSLYAYKVEKGVSFWYCVSVSRAPVTPASLSHLHCFLYSFMPPRHKTGFVLVLQPPYFIVGASGTAFDLASVTHQKPCKGKTWNLVNLQLCVKTHTLHT